MKLYETMYIYSYIIYETKKLYDPNKLESGQDPDQNSCLRKKTPPPPPPPQQQQQPRVSTGFFRKAADDIPTNAAPIGTYKVPSWDERDCINQHNLQVSMHIWTYIECLTMINTMQCMYTYLYSILSFMLPHSTNGFLTRLAFKYLIYRIL